MPKWETVRRFEYLEGRANLSDDMAFHLLGRIEILEERAAMADDRAAKLEAALARNEQLTASIGQAVKDDLAKLQTALDDEGTENDAIDKTIDRLNANADALTGNLASLTNIPGVPDVQVPAPVTFPPDATAAPIGAGATVDNSLPANSAPNSPTVTDSMGNQPLGGGTTDPNAGA